jgi:anti-sigma factor RsiW
VLSMDCSEFEDRLERLQGGLLTAEERQAVEDHLAACEPCRELIEAATEGLNVPPLKMPRDLTRSILERTSGSACRRVREHLCDFVDGKLEGSYGEILSLHLADCVDCSALAASLAELKEILPQMSEVEPGMNFTFRVLRATSRLSPELRVSLWSRIQQWWLRLIQRPRFSWEAAYLGTILLVTVLGNPLTTFQELSLRAAAIYQSKSSFTWVSVALPGSLVRSEDGALKCTREFVDALSRRQQEFAASAVSLLEQGAQSLQSNVQSEFRATGALAKKTLAALQRAWATLFPRHTK